MNIRIVAGRTILAREAIVKTAMVQIKALTIEGKQITLAVFRQLQDEEIIDPKTGQLCGVPWGLVNYKWTHHDHPHVIWQKGVELRRSCLNEHWRPDSSELSWKNEEVQGWSKLILLLQIEEGEIPNPECGFALNQQIKVGGWTAQVYLTDPWRYTHQGTRQLLRQSLVQDWSIPAGISLAEAKQRFVLLCEQADDLKKAHQQAISAGNANHNTLWALEQIFIAV